MSNFVLMGIVAAMLIPVQSIIIPLYVNAAHLHVVNSYLGAVVIYAALGHAVRDLPDDRLLPLAAR